MMSNKLVCLQSPRLSISSYNIKKDSPKHIICDSTSPLHTANSIKGFEINRSSEISPLMHIRGKPAKLQTYASLNQWNGSP